MHEGAFTAYSVRDASRKQRSEQLPEHNGRGNHGGHECGEVEGGDEEEERARDGAKVVAVDQADDPAVVAMKTLSLETFRTRAALSFPGVPIRDAGIVA